jgi:leucyl aminopeptidase (aminopeptidase T)
VRADTTTYLMVETLRPLTHISAGLRRIAEEADLVVYVLEPRSEEMSFRRELVEAALVNGRVCMMPGITAEMMSRLVNLNYAALQDLGTKIVEKMSGAREVRVTNEAGTDVTFSVYGRRWLNDSGDIGQKGLHGNLPAGECFTSPVEETFSGVIHFSLIDEKSGKGMARFEKGRLAEYKGRGISAIVDLIGRDPGGKIIGEIGIGTNRNAQVGRSLLESEKAYGAIHFGMGDSYGLGPNRSKHHYDMLVEKATVVADGQVVLEKGQFLV